MNKKILEYRKTAHFLFRQWERGITDLLLYSVLPFASSKEKDTLILLVEKSVLSKNHKNLQVKNLKKYLALIIKEKTLNTCFWCQSFKQINKANKELLIIKE